jgi:hypothetical protein
VVDCADETNVAALRRNDITVLYHFTDAANLDSIRKQGLLSAASVFQKGIESALNSDETSRAMDKKMGLEDYVRLSFNAENPMKYVAQNEKRISRAVMLQIKLEVVSRPGVLFFDCNATRHDAVQSSSPSVVHFDVVKADNQFAVAPEKKHFYQAEVLVPSPLPPHLIIFPENQAPARGKRVPVPRREETKTEGGERSKPELPGVERVELRETKRCTAARPTTVTTSRHTLDDGRASLVSQDDALSASGDKGGKLFAKFNAWLVSLLLCRYLAAVSLSLTFAIKLHQYLATLPFLQRMRLHHASVFLQSIKPPPLLHPAKDTTRCELILGSSPCGRPSASETSCCGHRRCLVHDKVCWCTDACLAKKKPKPAETRPLVLVERCDMPTQPPKPRCQTCKLGLENCPFHSIPCKNAAFGACNFCSRYNCETGGCKTKICCIGAENRLKELELLLKNDPAAVVPIPVMPVPALLPATPNAKKRVMPAAPVISAVSVPVPALLPCETVISVPATVPILSDPAVKRSTPLRGASSVNNNNIDNTNNNNNNNNNHIFISNSISSPLGGPGNQGSLKDNPRSVFTLFR